MNRIDFAKRYYDKFSKAYDLLSPDIYYRQARQYAIEQLRLEPHHVVLNVPCGTGQNFPYFQRYLANSGQIIGVDLSTGMLEKARGKSGKHGWANVELHQADVGHLSSVWLSEHAGAGEPVMLDAVLCDLGLSGFPAWREVIDQLLAMLKPGGRIVIMDWYLEEVTLRGRLIKWIGKGEVDRPVYQYLDDRVDNFHVNRSFNRGGVFVAAGDSREQNG